jgi:glyceraldehyde-3-phosphate dehydrogenase/erythrose-4-phosphate dehydrogenase
MGRLALRAAWGWPDVEFVHINETKGGAETAAHLLEFDSVHGRWKHDIKASAASMTIDGKKLTFSERSAPGEVDWRPHGVDLVLECSGKFRTTQLPTSSEAGSRVPCSQVPCTSTPDSWAAWQPRPRSLWQPRCCR